MSTQIPVDYTKTISDFTDIYDSTTPPTDTTNLPPITRNTNFPLEKNFSGEVGGVDHLEGTYRIRAGDLKRWLFQGVGTIKEWQAETEYFPTYIDANTGLLYPPDIVTHNGDLYITIEQHTTDYSFSDISFQSGNVALDRIVKNSDMVYNEITASMSELFDVGQLIGQYTTNRRFIIYKEYAFPHGDRESPHSGYHMTKCNASITTPIVVDIQRRNRYVGVQTIGTITFTPDLNETVEVDGVLVFNDSSSGVNASTELFLDAGDTLLFTMNTVDSSLEWVSINLLGAFINLTSPYFNIRV